MMYPEVLYVMGEDLFTTCRKKGLRLAVAESCTGGLLSGCITSVAGASHVFERGFITYSNKSKGELLGVPAHIFMEHGATSAPCAIAMAEGALTHAKANLSAAITGIAGPEGSDNKPAGLVFIACAREGFQTLLERHQFSGDRERVRLQAVESALRLLNQMAAN
ncbi:MAG: CinA family protein [Rhodospirillales bacterium]|nr:CinA family protein [Rhodospirillales bacterium]